MCSTIGTSEQRVAKIPRAKQTTKSREVPLCVSGPVDADCASLSMMAMMRLCSTTWEDSVYYSSLPLVI